MKCFTKRIPYQSRSDVIKIYPLGDLHLGHRLTREDLFQEIVAQIAKDPLSFWIGMGDMLEAITRKDLRHLESHYAEWLWGEDDVIKAQQARLLELLNPIAPKCLGYILGNHEESLLRREGRDTYYVITEWLVSKGSEPPITLGTQGFVRLRLQRRRLTMPFKKKSYASWTVILQASHGHGGGRLPGSAALKLGRLATTYDADIFLMGHLHRKQLIQAQRVGMKTGSDDLETRNIYALVTGSFLPGFDIEQQTEVYSEIKGFPPQPLGCPIIEIKPDKHSVRVKI